MSARAPREKFQFLSIPQNSGFIGGINTLDLPTDIEDFECVNLINFELDERDNLVSRGGVDSVNSSATSRITSIHHCRFTNGTINNIITYGTSILETSTATSIKGAATLPSDTYWQWKTFTDLAIGVNQGTGANTNPVKWTGTGNIAQLVLTDMPPGTEGYKFIEVWNNRLWLVASSHPNRLLYSDLGTAEGWGGFIEVDFNDGDVITGIFATKENMFIFKRKSIHRIVTGIGGKVNTDDTGWSREIVTKQVGCVSAYTIQEVLGDVIFLSDYGVQSLRAVQEFGAFGLIPLSRKIDELSTFNRNIATYGSVVFNKFSQYYLTLTETSTGVINTIVYVMDFKRLLENNPRWFKFRFEGYPITTFAHAFNTTTNEEQIFLGCDTPTFDLLRRRSLTKLFNDVSTAIYKEFTSKAFSLGDSFKRKEVHNTGYLISFTQNNCNVSFVVRFDEDTALSRSNSINFVNAISGAMWDVENWDDGVYAGSASNDKIFLQRMAGGRVHRGRTVDFTLTNNQLSQDISIKKLALEVGLLDLEAIDQ